MDFQKSRRARGKLGKSHRRNGMGSPNGFGWEEPANSKTKCAMKRAAAKVSRRDARAYLSRWLD